MQELTRKLFGYIEFEIEKGDVERFLTLCQKNSVRIWNMKRNKDKFSACTTLSGYKAFLVFRRKTKAKIKIKKKKGFPFFIRPVYKRKGIILGMISFIIIYCFLSMHIWSVNVEGNVNIPSDEVLNIAKNLGLYKGVLKNQVNAPLIKENLMYALTDTSWVSVNTLGCTATICIKEKTAAPEIIDKSYPSNVYASFSGQIIEMDVFGGTAKVKVGDTVNEGEMLISAVVKTKNEEEYLTHAYGDVIARTRRVINAEIPKEEIILEDTDEVIYRCSCDILGVTLPLTLNGIPKGNYKKEAAKFPFYIGKIELPITVYKEKWTKVNEVKVINKKEEAQKRAKEELNEKFKTLYPNAQIEKVSFFFNETKNKYILTGAYICRENISKVSSVIDKTTNFE